MADVRLGDDNLESESAVDALEYTHYQSGEFSRRVHRDWIKSRDPQSIITDNDPASISIGVNTDLSLRIGTQKSSCAWTWHFEIRTIGRQLKNLALSLDVHRDNFSIKAVQRDGKNIGYCDGGQEWYDPVTRDSRRDLIGETVISYLVTIIFEAGEHGTFRQNVLFGFEGYPVVRRKICADFVPFNDLTRLDEATRYFLNQTAHVWSLKNTTGDFHPFESPFVPGKDTWEKNLSKAYPYLGELFMLSHATLTENCLTRKNYRGRMHELIAVEELARHEQVARYNSIVDFHLASCYVLSSHTDGSTTAKYAPLGELFAQLSLGRGISEDMKSGRLLLRGCNNILIKMYNPDDNSEISSEIFEAHVEDKCNYMIYARLSKHCVERLNLKPDTQVKMHVQFVLSRMPFCEWHRAVDCLPDERLVFPDPNFQLTMRLPPIPESNEDWYDLLDNRLNDKQREALTLMIAPNHIYLPPILLLGPYGTGKTFTIAQALLIILHQNPLNKVLLCTQSNSAADLYVKEFFDEWYIRSKKERLKPMRIYYKRRLRNTVHATVRKYCLTDPNGYFCDPTKQDIENCGLIVTTLATSSCLIALDYEPTHIVIDEAAQALECEAITPLALVGTRTRLILSGDQMQLAPEVYSDLSKERGLGMSLLERLHNLYPPRHPCRINLCQNYRSHAAIVQLTSNLFYGNEIESSGPLLPEAPNFKPLIFYAVAGTEIQGEFSTGFYNDEEAVELAKQIAFLKSRWPVEEWGPFSEDSIGVLAHYSEQVARIRNELRKRKLFSVSVERVLNVQGKQFTAVFISTVRTRNCCRYSAENSVSDYGFLTNPRLLNTAITRAKALVAVVGDPVALLTTGPCRSLWGKYFQKAKVWGIPYLQLKEHMMHSQAPPVPLGPPLNPLAREFVPRKV
ncbi:GSCOCG00001810001-RA-CDS [Cotesia congregata]|uniref:Similar to helz: Probable helicase with zinc finger domain (Danio rerio) n=1 Tax=Cotesia congregata TaxID=51543 RepID=A0A8J2MTH8_COTCN|nr:GSCOCG00001810001-RA-CDS [Cotesia congregata]CAG5107260.1 Similar to helz: Probable helicase with zinc finger domain (Danio rerio) [Cotesia congregata]